MTLFGQSFSIIHNTAACPRVALLANKNGIKIAQGESSPTES